MLRRPAYRLPLGKKIVRFVDGFSMRYMMPDLDIILWREKDAIVPTRFIPKDEIWIDWRYKKEAQFLLDAMRIESSPRFRKSPYSRIRQELKLRLCRQGPLPDFTVRQVKMGKLTVKYVRGEIVRQYLDPAFIFGGHGLIYDYIPKDELWIDLAQDRREIPFTVLHELRERALMARGMSYNEAHAKSIERELVPRARKFTVDLEAPLQLKPFRQSPGLCGPASLKIALAYFGRHHSEKMLERLCHAKPETGTDHADLVAAARRLGATVFAKANGTLEELYEAAHVRRLPAIVGWFSPTDPKRPEPDEDHFSVVAQITEKKIVLMDPEKESGTTELTLKQFEEQWWDTDSSAGGGKVHRWYMTVET